MPKEHHTDESEFLQDARGWAKSVLRSRFEEVFARRGDVLHGKDIEDVHQMRVAIRRLRSALYDFSKFFEQTLLETSKKDLKRLADALGKARDNDVAVAALEKLRKAAPEKFIRKQIRQRISKKQCKRKEEQKILEEILDLSLIETVRGRFDTEIEHDFTRKSDEETLTVRQAGREIISKSLQEFGGLSPSLYEPFDCEHLHELRIAAKRLRYAVELFSECWREKILPFAREIAQMQDFLGEIHDQDLWIANTGERLRRTSGKKHRANLWLLAQFTKKRDKNYRASLELWSRWQKRGFIHELQHVING